MKMYIQSCGCSTSQFDTPWNFLKLLFQILVADLIQITIYFMLQIF